MAEATGGGLVGTLYIRLVGQNEDLNKKMEDSEQKVKKHTKGMEAAAESLTHVLEALGLAFGVAEIVHFIKETIEATDELKKLSEELGIGIEKLAGFKFAADKANVGDQFSIGMRTFAKSIREAMVEGSDMQLMFRQLDLNPKMPPDKIFEDVVARFGQMESSVDRLGIAQDLFGTRNARFVNLLSGGTEGLNRDVQELARITGMSYEEAAAKAEAYHDSMTTLKYALQGLVLTMTNEALPAITEWVTAISENLPQLKEYAKEIGTGIVFAVNTAALAFKGFMGVMKVLGIFLVDILQQLLEIANFIEGAFVTAWEFWANGAIKAINFVISGFNSMADKLPDWVKEKLGISGGQAVKPIELFKIETPENMKTMDEWIGILHDTREELANQLAADFTETAKVIKQGNEEVNNAIKSGPKIKAGDLVSPEELKKFNERLKGMVGEAGFYGAADFQKTSGAMRVDIANRSDIAGLGEHVQHGEDEKQIENQLLAIQKLRDSHIKITDEQEKRLTELERLYADKRKAIQMQEVQLRLKTAENMFGDLATITKAWAGEQSNIYKAMFVASKAFAIAEATVKIAQGIAAAAANPWPENLFAMASVIAATASIVSSIQSVTLEFGGGKAMGGPVDAGKAYIVGEQGQEVFVPKSNGSIIPNNRLGGGGGNVQVNVYNQFGGEANVEVQQKDQGDQKILDIYIRKASKDVAAQLRDGRGEVTQALQSSYPSLKRGGK